MDGNAPRVDPPGARTARAPIAGLGDRLRGGELGDGRPELAIDPEVGDRRLGERDGGFPRQEIKGWLIRYRQPVTMLVVAVVDVGAV